MNKIVQNVIEHSIFGNESEWFSLSCLTRLINMILTQFVGIKSITKKNNKPPNHGNVSSKSILN